MSNSLIILLLIFVSILIYESNALNRFKRLTNSQYFVSTQRRDFIKAYMDCKTGGMELISILDENEQNAVNEALQGEPTGYPYNGYWLAAYIQYTGAWYWMHNGTKMTYTNWGTNQPYNFKGDQNCLRLGNFIKTDEPRKWSNVNCFSENLYYICKILE